MVKLAASISAASFLNIQETISTIENAGIDIIHFDIEDGSFTPQLNLGIKIISDVRKICTLPFDVHLMVNNPEWLISPLAEYGVNMISVHYEACPYPRRTLRKIQDFGIQAGLAFNPISTIPHIKTLMPYLNFILVLSTEPEDGQQNYIPEVLEKIRLGKEQEGAREIIWEIDGGINKENLEEVIKAGADIIVSGRAIFEQGEIRTNIEEFKRTIDLIN